MPMNKFKTVAIFTYPAEAAVMKAKLESENIEVILRDEITIGVDPFAAQAIGGVKMDVHTEDYIKALGIVETNATDSSSSLTSNKTCPNCGKRSVRERQDITNARNFKERLQAVWLSIFPFGSGDTYRCNHCEHTFNGEA